MGYTKLFTEIIMSTVWREPDHVRLLWITMLALKDRWHIVNASLPGLADSARITIEECEQALKVLSGPDAHSRTKDYEGRRIEPCDGGWLILNGEKYRNKMSLDERREYQRIKQREYRQKKKEASTSCQQSGQQLTHTDTEADTEADTKDQKKGRFTPPTLQEVKQYCRERKNSVDPETFIDFYTANGWVQSRGKKIKDWQACIRTWEKRERTAEPKSFQKPKFDGSDARTGESWQDYEQRKMRETR